MSPSQPTQPLMCALSLAVARGQLALLTAQVRLQERLWAQRGRSLLDLGFVPSFFQVVDVVIEARVDVGVCSTTERGLGGSVQARGVLAPMNALLRPMNARRSTMYQQRTRASSAVRAHLSALPAPPAILARLRADGVGTT